MQGTLRSNARTTPEPWSRSTPVVSRTFRDASEVGELQRRDADCDFVQTSRGPFQGSTIRLDLGDTKLQRTSTHPETVHQARIGTDLIALLVPTRADALHWDGVRIERPALLVFDEHESFVRRARSLRGVSIGLDRALLVSDAAARAGVHAGELRLPRGVVADHEPGVRHLIRLARWIDQLAEENPQALGRATCQQLIRETIRDAAGALLAARVGAGHAHPPSPGARLRIVHRAEAHVRHVGPARVSLSTLCRATGVSERTLQYAFGDVYGMSPHTYLKSLRLAAARRILLRSPDERGAVKRAALDAGFRQLGRFSVEYRQFFAESPSETLARHGGARPR